MLVPTGNRPSPAPGAQASTVSGWRVGDIAIDVGEARATVRGEAVELDRSGHALLLHLVEHAGQVVGKDDLLRVGWPGRVVSENSLAKAISKLRQALGDDDGTLIRVVHGYGYRFSAAAEAIRLPPQSAPTVGNTIRHKLAMGLAAAAIAAAALMFALRGASPPTVPPDAAGQSGVRIAVVPFRDLSADQSLALLADGFATHLRDQIQRVPNLRHLPRSEVVPFGKDVRDAAEIAGDLGVDLLVTGAVDRNRDHLQVTLRLYDARERRPLLEQRFARAPADQASLQQDALAALLDRLGRHPGRRAYDPDSGRGTTVPEAYRAFLRASSAFSGNNDPNNQRRALAALEQAVELDPQYADAWLMLGGILGGSGYYADSSDELRTGRIRAVAAMDRGIALAPADPLNYLLRSEMRLLYRFDWAGAQADIDEAAARTRSGESAMLLIWKARYAASLGRIDEAIALDARAIALDPNAGARRNQGWHYLAKGDIANARAVLALQLVDLPESPHVHFYLALCDIFEHQPDAALRRLEHSSTLFRLVGTSIAQHERGDRTASDLALNKLADQFAVADGYWVAAAYAWRGETDAAFQWLDRALAGGDSSVMYLPFDPLMQRLRDDPRYAQRLSMLKLPLD